MTDAERQIGRIKAIMYASEEVIASAKNMTDKSVVQTAMEVAYEHIRDILDNPDYCPWAE